MLFRIAIAVVLAAFTAHELGIEVGHHDEDRVELHHIHEERLD
jgi:hypothetical protein